MVHNDACNERQKAVETFKAKHPKHCTTCGGSGAWYSHGSRDEPPDGGPCGCVEAGKCPLCASDVRMIETEHADYSKCDTCGWDEQAIIEGKALPEICPEVDCYCHEEQAMEDAACEANDERNGWKLRSE